MKAGDKLTITDRRNLNASSMLPKRPSYEYSERSFKIEAVLGDAIVISEIGEERVRILHKNTWNKLKKTRRNWRETSRWDI